MKKKAIIHPKLYLDVVCNEGFLHLNFISNKFNLNGTRMVEEEAAKDDMEINKKKYLKDINLLQFNFLKKYIEIQKRVLVKHEKDGNYDSIRVVNFSLSTMIEFKQDFEKWFNENK